MWDRRALALAPDSVLAVGWAAVLALSLWRLGRADEAYRLLEAARTSDRDDDLHLLGMRGWLRFAEDDLDSARVDLEAAAASELRLGALLISSVHLTVLARVQFAMGDWADAVVSAEQALALVSETEHPHGAFVWWSVILVPAARGDWATADAYAARAAAEPRDPVDRRIAVGMAIALVAGARGDHEAVLARARAGLRAEPQPGASTNPASGSGRTSTRRRWWRPAAPRRPTAVPRSARAARRPPRPAVDDRAPRSRARAHRGGARAVVSRRRRRSSARSSTSSDSACRTNGR